MQEMTHKHTRDSTGSIKNIAIVAQTVVKYLETVCVLIWAIYRMGVVRFFATDVLIC